MSRGSRELYQRTVAPMLQQFSQVALARAEEDRNKAIVEDPNSSQLQKTLAFTKLAGSQAGAQYLKNQANQSALQNLRAEENRLFGNVPMNPPQGAGGPQQATRNAANTFMNPQAFAQPGADMGQNVPPNAQMGGQEQPPQQVQKQLSPEEKVEAYRRLESISDDQNLHEKAMEYRSRAEAEESKIKERNRVNNDIQKEERTRIREFSKPFENTEELRTNRNKLMEAKKLIKSGRVSLDTNTFRNAFQAILEGKDDSYIANLFKTPEQQKLWYLLRPSLQSKDIGGSNPSTREVLIAMSSLPNEFKGQEANEFIIENMINDAELKLEKGSAINKLEREKGLDFGTFRDRLEREIAPVQERLQRNIENLNVISEAKKKLGSRVPKKGHVFMLDPKGNIREIKNNDIKSAQESRGILIE